eukprot:551650_1
MTKMIHFFLCDSEDYKSQLSAKQPQYSIIEAKYNPDLKRYGAPFIYGGVERMIFMRSNELLNNYYSKNVKIYENLMYVKSSVFAWVLSFFLWFIPMLLTWSCFRSCFIKLVRSMSFKPGQGPSLKEMTKEKWREIIYIDGINKKNNKKLRCEVQVNVYGNYGYLNTSKLLIEQGMICTEERNNPKIRKIPG